MPQLISRSSGQVQDKFRTRAADGRGFLMCAKHVQQLGGESPLPSLMETKG
jgi:hypothetical protein